MGSLSHCISIHSLEKPIAEKIRKIQKEYLADGYTGEQATKKATLEIIKESQSQRADIIKQINQQLEANYPEIVPKKEHKGITKLRKKLKEIVQVDDTSKTADALRKLAKKFKKKVVFFKGTKKVNGFFDPSHPDTLFINSGTNKAMLFVFGHELLHNLKKDNRGMYIDLFKALLPHVDNFDTYFEKENKRRTDKGDKALSPMKMAEEFFADFTGEQFTDEKFWDKLLKKDKTLFDKVADLFQKLFAKIDNTSDEYFRDINTAQDALASVMKRYTEEQRVQAEEVKLEKEKSIKKAQDAEKKKAKAKRKKAAKEPPIKLSTRDLIDAVDENKDYKNTSSVIFSKILKILKGKNPDAHTVLNYNIDGHGTPALQHTASTMEIDSFSNDINDKKYDLVIAADTLNNVEPGLRDSVLTDIGSRVNVDGSIAIVAREWEGFNNDDLVKRIKKVLGSQFVIEKIEGVGKIGLLVKKKKPLSKLIEEMSKAVDKEGGTVEDFTNVGDTQRGYPERAMVAAQMAIGGGVMNGAIEHVGDLTHRMTETAQYNDSGYSAVKDKVTKTLRWLTDEYGFEREHRENLKSNAKSKGVPLEEYTAKVNKWLELYSKAHEGIPVYNKVQRVARDAAIALGRGNIDEAVSNLRILEKHLETPEDWKRVAHEGLKKEAQYGTEKSSKTSETVQENRTEERNRTPEKQQKLSREEEKRIDTLYVMIGDMEAGEPGKRTAHPRTGQPIIYKSTYPDWFSNRGLNKKDILIILNKAIRGDKLTENQQIILDESLELAEWEHEQRYGGETQFSTRDFIPPRTKDGKFKGAPEIIETIPQLRSARKLWKRLVNEGAHERYWYENSSKGILRVTNNKLADARKLTQMLAIYSPNQKVFVNTMLAVRAYNQWKMGVPREKFKVTSKRTDNKAISVLYDNAQTWGGRKTSSFYDNLMHEILKNATNEQFDEMGISVEEREIIRTPSTVDVWMLRAFGYYNDKVSSVDDYKNKEAREKAGDRYSFVENEVDRLVEIFNEDHVKPGEDPWLPHQIQAAIWVAMRNRYEDEAVKKKTREASVKAGYSKYGPNEKGVIGWRTPTEAEKGRAHRKIWRKNALKMVTSKQNISVIKNSPPSSFTTALGRMTQQTTWETIPSTKLNHMVNDASFTVQQMFTIEAQKLILDEFGNNKLALLCGVPLAQSIVSEGGYDNEIHPNVLTGLTPNKTKGDFDRDNVRLYTRLIQYIFKQDAVPWFRADPQGTFDKEFKVKVGKTHRLFDTLEEAQAFAEKKGLDDSAISGGPFSLGVRFTFKNEITPELEQTMLQELTDRIHPSSGLTRISPNQLIVVSFRDDTTGMPVYYNNDNTTTLISDHAFLNKIGELLQEKQIELGIEIIEQIPMEAEYGPTHEWDKNPNGAEILDQEGIKRRPDLQQYARDRREAFEQLLDRYTDEELKEKEKEVEQGETLFSTREELVKPPVDENKEVELVHWSRQEGIQTLYPRFHGEGITGAESKRKASDPENWIDRSYYGIAPGQPGGYRKEPSLGNNEYVARVPLKDLYDFNKDPDKLIPQAQETVQNNPFNNLTNIYEKMISEKGYKGYWSKSQMGLTAAVFAPLDVQDGDTLFSTRDLSPKETWYSKMTQVLAKKLPGKGTGKMLANMVQSWVKKGEFKKDELAWSGLTDWLNEQEGKVTKQQVLDYLKENNLQVEFDVTDKTRDAAMEGQPLFSTRDLGKQNQVDEVVKEIFQSNEDAENTIIHRVVHAVKTAMDNTGKANISKTLDDMRTFMVDRYNPIDKELGKTIYRLHRMLNNSAATFGTFLQHGNLSWDNGALTVLTKNEGVVPWLQSLGKEGHKFLYWVAAKRAEKLEEQDREKWFTKDKRDVILNDVEYRRMTRQYEQWNKKLQEYNSNIIDIAEEAGLISKEAREQWMSHYYLPFYRLLEDEYTAEEFTQGPLSSKKYISSGIRALKGEAATIGDPMHNLIRNWSHLIAESQRQMARSSAGELMVSMGMAEEMTAGQLTKVLGVISTYGVRGLDPTGKITWKQFEGMNKEEVLKFIDENPGTSLIEKQRINTVPDVKKAAQVMSFMREGKPVYLKVADPDLYEALTQVNSKALTGSLVGGIGFFKRLLTIGATFGPAFRVANFLRDTIHTSVVSKSFLPFIDSAKGLVQVWRQSPDYIELMASGGGFSQGYLNSADPRALSRTINKIVKQEGKEARNFILDSPFKLLAFWEEVGHASEMAARVQLYTNLKGEGKSHLEAAYEAKDLLDFGLTGNSDTVRVLTATIPFLNARMQGLDRMARGAVADPRAFITKGLIVAAASLALWAAYRDDDRYKELEEWDKWQYYHFWIGDQHYRIPKPFEVGAVFSTIFETAAESMTEEEDMSYFFDMLKFTFVNTFAVGTPAAITPLLEVYSNKSFFTGRAIEPQWMKGLEPGARFNPWESETLKVIGKNLNISPVKLKSLIRGYTATIGTGLLATADFMMEFREDVKTPQKYFHEYLGLDRFIKSRVGGTKYAQRYYEFANEATETFNTINNYIRTGDMDTARQMAKDTPSFRARKAFVTLVNKKLALIRKKEKIVWGNTTMSRETKRKKLEGLRKMKNGIYKQAYTLTKDKFKK